MLLLMIEHGMPIDMVLTADTGMEFPEMYEHLDKLDRYLYQERGIHLTILRHPKGFEWLMFEEPKQKASSIENRMKLGVSLNGNGWPGVKVRWCTGQLKTHLISKEVNRLKGEYHAIHYVGIAADEPKRIKNERYPLVEWGITENEALKICYDRGYDWGGLYEIYHRCSCWCCPLQRIDELRKLRRHHPELWARLMEMDKRALAQFGHNPLGQFKQNWTVEALERRFAMEESQISVFDFIEEDLMKKKEFDSREAEDVADMIRGVSPKSILISFGDKPAKPLEEYVKDQKKENTSRKKNRNDMERYEMVAAAMESKRLGLCQKSLFVVPNHLTEQWASEFLQLYPAANILVATKKDFETKNRKKFCGRIATGDYDAVIIGHSQFEKIPMSVERQRAILEQQMEEIMWGIQEAKADKAENFTIKQMEKTRKGLQMKLDKLNDQSRKDDVVTFEELGVDRIFIDESHYYKNLFLYTKMRNVGGIAQTEAQKSSDLFMKCRYLDEITGGRGIVFATGTPISNSMVELYTIQRYLQMNALQEQGLQHFDSWAANYGETVTAIELSPEGTGYRAKTRFAKFYNLPELMSVFKNVADIQTADMLKLPVPEAHYHNIALKPSEYQKDMVASLAERAEKVRNREVDSSVDNMLLITNDGRKLALDQRLINPMLPSDRGSKAAKCAENVFEIWQRTADQRSTQMIFCDLSTPKGDGSFSVYDDIRAKLLELGVPENEIAYIHNAKSEAQKKDLFGKVRSGQVRILLGSTQRMGAGTNCQQKLIALHHLDCPWRPSDLQQREGRIIRQGNENPEVDIYSYVTEGTFDAYLYQLVESKQKFISQIMTSKSPVRSAEDVDEQALSYAEIKALASGNPMIKEKMDLDIEVSKLKLLKSNHLSQRYALEDSISKTFPREIAETQARLAGYGADITTVKEQTHPNDDGFAPMTLAGVTYAEKKEAGAALLALCQNMLSPEATQVGSYRGLTLELSFDSFAQEYKLAMIGQLRHVVTLGTDVFGNIQRMDNALDTLPVKEQVCRERLSDLQAQLETAKVEVQKPFPREEELKAKTARLEELNALLNLDKREPEVVDAEPDENQRPPARPAAQMER